MLYSVEIDEQNHRATVEAAWPPLAPRKIAVLNRLVAVHNALTVVPTVVYWLAGTWSVFFVACRCPAMAGRTVLLPFDIVSHSGQILQAWIVAAVWVVVIASWFGTRVTYRLYREMILPIEVARLRRLAPFRSGSHWTNQSN